jgi:hypothetical protein
MPKTRRVSPHLGPVSLEGELVDGDGAATTCSPVFPSEFEAVGADILEYLKFKSPNEQDIFEGTRARCKPPTICKRVSSFTINRLYSSTQPCATNDFVATSID